MLTFYVKRDILYSHQCLSHKILSSGKVKKGVKKMLKQYSVDTSALRKAVAAGESAVLETKIANSKLSLANLKLEIANLQVEAQKVIAFLQEHNALTDGDVLWAKSQGIKINTEKK